eukprot:347947-Chlamydomonas_euryale.AAC.24
MQTRKHARPEHCVLGMGTHGRAAAVPEQATHTCVPLLCDTGCGRLLQAREPTRRRPAAPHSPAGWLGLVVALVGRPLGRQPRPAAARVVRRADRELRATTTVTAAAVCCRGAVVGRADTACAVPPAAATARAVLCPVARGSHRALGGGGAAVAGCAAARSVSWRLEGAAAEQQERLVWLGRHDRRRLGLGGSGQGVRRGRRGAGNLWRRPLRCLRGCVKAMRCLRGHREPRRPERRLGVAATLSSHCRGRERDAVSAAAGRADAIATVSAAAGRADAIAAAKTRAQHGIQAGHRRGACRQQRSNPGLRVRARAAWLRRGRMRIAGHGIAWRRHVPVAERVVRHAG